MIHVFVDVVYVVCTSNTFAFTLLFTHTYTHTPPTDHSSTMYLHISALGIILVVLFRE